MPTAPFSVDFGPSLTPPRVSLLTSVPVLELDNDRFGAGVTVQFDSCGSDGTAIRKILCTDDQDPIVSTHDGASAEFISYVVLGSHTCSAYGIKDPEFFRAKALNKLNACISKQIASELWSDVESLENDHIASSDATDVSDDTALDPDMALALLDNTLGTASCGQASLIHVTPYMLHRLIHNTNGEVTTQIDDNGYVQYFSAMGNQIIADYGYPGTSPGGDDPDAAEWMYTTAPVWIYLGPIDQYPDTMSEAFNRQTNDITFYAQRTAIAVFDTTCSHFAAKVDRGDGYPT